MTATSHTPNADGSAPATHASCACGKLSADILQGAKPFTIACHCTSCQKRSGSPFGMVAYFHPDEVTIKGTPSEFTRDTDSGSTLTNGFCGTCGSSLYIKLAGIPHFFGITVGSISDPNFGPPALSVYEECQHGWIEIPENTQRFDRGRA